MSAEGEEPYLSATAEKPRKRRSVSSNTKCEEETAATDASQGHAISSASKEAKTEDLGSSASAKAFVFWAYFVGFVSLITLAFTIVYSLAPLDEKGEFLAMPAAVRQHLSKGRMIKVAMGADRQPIKVFVRSEGSQEAEAVLMIHGAGGSSFSFRKLIPLLAERGHFAIAVDLPGSGLSQKSILREADEAEIGFVEAFLWRCRQVYQELQQKGLFWRLEELFETGQLPEVLPLEVKTDPRQRPVAWHTTFLANILRQVLDLYRVSAVHLVVHDTAGLLIGQAFAAQYPTQIRGVTILDALPHKSSFPLALLSIPGIGYALSRPVLLYRALLQACCVAELSMEDAEAYGFLLQSGNGRQALRWIARNLNQSMDLDEWATEEALNGILVQILWASGWSDEWAEEGRRLSARLTNANFVSHQGSRWPQEDAAKEISKVIGEFVSSLAPSVQPSTPEEFPEHIQRTFDEMAKSGGESEGHSHKHGGHSHSHNHHQHNGHGAAYPGAHGTGMDLGAWGL